MILHKVIRFFRLISFKLALNLYDSTFVKFFIISKTLINIRIKHNC
jgi:hypothetical protein